MKQRLRVAKSEIRVCTRMCDALWAHVGRMCRCMCVRIIHTIHTRTYAHTLKSFDFHYKGTFGTSRVEEWRLRLNLT